MRWFPALLACGLVASPAWSQSFAPDQPRVMTSSRGVAPARVMPGIAGLGGVPDPAPFGLGGTVRPSRNLEHSGQFLLPGGQVTIPGNPGTSTTSQLYTIYSPDGGRHAIYYDAATGQATGYDLSTSVGRFFRPYDPLPPFASLATEAGTGSFSGLTTNPSVTGIPNSGIPAINPLTPSASYLANPYVGPLALPPGSRGGVGVGVGGFGAGSNVGAGPGLGGASPSLPSFSSALGGP